MFVCAITLGIRRPDIRAYFEQRSQELIEIVKLGIFVVFGSLLTLGGLFHDGVAAVAIVRRDAARRPARRGLARAGRDGTPAPVKAFMAWFGPKGVATMTFSLLVLASGIDAGERLFDLAALVVVCSVVAHGLTDHAGVAWIERRAREDPPARDPAQEPAATEAAVSPGREYTARHHSSASTRIDSVASPPPQHELAHDVALDHRQQRLGADAAAGCRRARCRAAGRARCASCGALDEAVDVGRPLRRAGAPRGPERLAASSRTCASRLTTATMRASADGAARGAARRCRRGRARRPRTCRRTRAG